MAEFLLELLSEEIPARMQASAAADLRRLAEKSLRDARLEWGGMATFVTPRRLVLQVEGLPVQQPEMRDERKGPRSDAPAKAIEGFLRSTGLTLDQCELRDTAKGKTWFAVIEQPGRTTAEVLPTVVESLLAAMPWPKSMRWGTGTFRWVRPLHQILAVFDGKALPGGIEPAPGCGYAFTDTTSGHRFLAPTPFQVTGFDDYQRSLRDAFVLLDPAERREAILTQTAGLATAEGLTIREDGGLLDEVTGLVEWPVVLAGRIDPQFMDVPPEVLVTAMRTHQRYFSCLDDRGRLAPRFVVVAGTRTSDGGRAVVDGNERVLRARLSDAKFFWDQDRKTPLDARTGALEDIIFHARLGSMAEKAARISGLAAVLAESIAGGQGSAARRAGALAKADLVSGMVGEFPELQGIMGRYYAAEQGEADAVALAIAEHYAPQGPNDRCPTAPASVAVALADKLDTLVGFFAIDERPTGSRDPYALRRAALGVIRLILENDLRLSLRQAFDAARVGYGSTLSDPGRSDELLAFFADRLKVALREQGTRHDLVDAVFSIGGEDDLVRLLARVDALAGFVGSEDGADLLVAYRRAANIVRIEAKKDGRTGFEAVEPAVFAQGEERALFDGLATARTAYREALDEEDFVAAMAVLAGLRGAVDAFFDQVTVNTEEPALRINRLALLSEIVATMNEVADFSRVEG